MSSHFEKPKGWNLAPQENWVSGKVIGQDDIRMPQLGDPAQHEGASERMSFSDEVETETSLYQGRMVRQCPAGTTSQDGVCTPDPKSEATLESKVRAATRGGKQWREGDGEGGQRTPDSLKRELPEAPKEADPQIRRLAKTGKRA